MRNILLLGVVLLVSSCATTAPESVPLKSKPQAVTNQPSASTEGALLKRSQDGYSATLQGLQSYLEESVRDLLNTLEQAKKSPPPTVPAEHSPSASNKGR